MLERKRTGAELVTYLHSVGERIYAEVASNRAVFADENDDLVAPHRPRPHLSAVR